MKFSANNKCLLFIILFVSLCLPAWGEESISCPSTLFEIYNDPDESPSGQIAISPKHRGWNTVNCSYDKGHYEIKGDYFQKRNEADAKYVCDITHYKMVHSGQKEPVFIREMKKYIGFGFEFSVDRKIMDVLRVAENSPANRAGLKRGDQIVLINDIKVKNTSMDEINKIFKENDEVKLKVNHVKEYIYVDMSMKKEEIDLPTQYISITSSHSMAMVSINLPDEGQVDKKRNKYWIKRGKKILKKLEPLAFRCSK